MTPNLISQQYSGAMVLLPAEQIESMINNAINKAFSIKTPESSIINEALKTREEFCKILNITKPTAISYEKRGLIRSIRIGRRALYYPKDINELITGKFKEKERKT